MRVVTVSALTEELAELLERSFAHMLVDGELRTLQQPASGHAYFSLGEGDTVLHGVVWRDDWRQIKKKPVVGERVRARGRLRLWAPQGRYQLYAHELRPVGEGEAARRQALARSRLAAEGLLDPRRHRPLPVHPRFVGLVTSLTGAALFDFARASRERFPAARILISAATVQGVDAPNSVRRAVELLIEDGRSEVIVVARGGGHALDLAAFQDEDLARFLATASPIPIVTAIGHEIDETLCDAVADAVAATPSAAAVLVLPDRAQWAQRVDVASRRGAVAMTRLCVAGRHRATAMLRRLRHPAEGIRWSKTRLRVSERLEPALLRFLEVQRQRVTSLEARLISLGPEAVLARGFAVVTRGSAVVRDAAGLCPGEALGVRLARGHLSVRVT